MDCNVLLKFIIWVAACQPTMLHYHTQMGSRLAERQILLIVIHATRDGKHLQKVQFLN